MKGQTLNKKDERGKRRQWEERREMKKIRERVR